MTVEPQGFACELSEGDLQTRASNWRTLAAQASSTYRTSDGFRIVYARPAAKRPSLSHRSREFLL